MMVLCLEQKKGMVITMISFNSFSGFVTAIDDFGCNRTLSVIGSDGNIVNFVVTPDTYFVDQEMVGVGDFITGYYDGNAPVALIFPPSYTALIIVRFNQNQRVTVDYFNSQLISSDGQLMLNISPYTQTMLKNGQPFTGNLANQNLLVVYAIATRSIPAQTTPAKIIVWC